MTAPSRLDDRLTEGERHQRRRAVAALLRRPLLTADGPHADDFRLVRRHAAELREWFARNPGWRLQVDREVARLRKIPADTADGTRPARPGAKASEPAFTRRRYVLLCLALAALERTAERQTALGKLAGEIVALVAADPALGAAGIAFDLEGRDQRRDLVHAVRLLLDLRVLTRVHGDERAYVDEHGDVLYTINRPVLAALLVVTRGPSTVDAGDLEARLAAITAEPVPDSDEGRTRRLRSALTRRLLDDPVVYTDDLDEDERDYLGRQRANLVGQVAAVTGLHPEIRAEGLAMVDDTGALTDVALPEEGTDGHLTLLLAEFLADHARRHPGLPVAPTALHARTAELIAQHRRHWRKAVTEPGADVDLAEATVDRLAALRLVARSDDGVVPLPAIARYALESPEETLPT